MNGCPVFGASLTLSLMWPQHSMCPSLAATPHVCYVPRTHIRHCNIRRCALAAAPIHCKGGWNHLGMNASRVTPYQCHIRVAPPLYTHTNNGAATAHSAAATLRIRIARPSTITTTHNGFSIDDRTAMLKSPSRNDHNRNTRRRWTLKNPQHAHVHPHLIPQL